MAEESKAKRFFSAIGSFLSENRGTIGFVVGAGLTTVVAARSVKSAVHEGVKLGRQIGKEHCELERAEEDEE
jgi:hypothetical protein